MCFNKLLFKIFNGLAYLDDDLVYDRLLAVDCLDLCLEFAANHCAQLVDALVLQSQLVETAPYLANHSTGASHIKGRLVLVELVLQSELRLSWHRCLLLLPILTLSSRDDPLSLLADSMDSFVDSRLARYYALIQHV